MECGIDHIYLTCKHRAALQTLLAPHKMDESSVYCHIAISCADKKSYDAKGYVPCRSSVAEEMKETEIESGSEVHDAYGFTMQQHENVCEHLENVTDDEEKCTVDWDVCDEYSDIEFVLKRCRQARQIGSFPRRQDHKTNKTERKRCRAIEARINKQANTKKKQQEKRSKKSNSQQPSNEDRQRQRYKHLQLDREDLKSIQTPDTRELEKHVELIPAQHIVNVKNLASGISQELLGLQERDLTPEDYEILLTLDNFVAPQTVHLDVIKTLVTSTITEYSNEVCSVCMEEYTVRQQVKTLPCCHTFHSQCIDQWLTTVSNRCPLDGQLLTH